MKLTYISSHPPRTCGLATFNKSLINAIKANLIHDVHTETVVAINDGEADIYSYPLEVKFVVRQQALEDYTSAAEFINNSDSDACILQHEFGIYGGNDGVYVLTFVNQLEKPLISIFHTVLERPSYQQKIILQTIAKRSDKIVVMGKRAVRMLKEIYGLPAHKIAYIEHGAPDLAAQPANPVIDHSLFNNRKTLLTFGLLSRNKGLETVIRALPRIVQQHPDVLYIILGATHPGIVKQSGEEYRESLIALAEKLGVRGNVEFINQFVLEEDLINYIAAADIYVSPYLNEAQITSGTLSYAIGAGAAVVATPYWHATEILAEGRGRLFDFKDERALADIINELLTDPVKLHTIKETALEYGRHLKWPVIGKDYINVITEALETSDLSEKVFNRVIDPEILPDFSLDYVRHLSDQTGIIQHARYGVPHLKEGYCTDDNARALLMTLMAHKLGFTEGFDLMQRYMSFMLYMQNEGGYFRNFLNYRNEYLDKMGSEDAFGRSIWALGYLACCGPDASACRFGAEMFCKAIPNFNNLRHLRGMANTIIGVTYYLQAHPADAELINVLEVLTNKLLKAYQTCKSKKWQWFEDYLTYDNAILPLALLRSARVTRDEDTFKAAYETLAFLENATMTPRYFNPVGNNGWYSRDGNMPTYDQQAIDAMAMTLMYAEAYDLTRDQKYIKKLLFTYSWFLGGNSLCVPLYDKETKGCYDGLHLRGVNMNQGAESTLAYLIAHLAVLQTISIDSESTSSWEKMEAVFSK